MEAPDIYQDAALADITLLCGECCATLDPDEDLGPDVSFQTEGWFVALANEAYRRGWLIEHDGLNAGHFDYRILCPECAGQPQSG